MDKALEGVSKVFSHLARDIMNYMFSGTIVLINLALIDLSYNEGRWLKVLKDITDYNPIILIIVAYIIGQVCLAFYAVLLEYLNLDRWFYSKLFLKRYSVKESFTDEDMLIDKGTLFSRDKSMYFHFVERNVTLTTVRWNYSSAFLISCIVDVCLTFNFEERKLLIWALIALFIAFMFMVLHVATQKEMKLMLETFIKLPETKPDVPADDPDEPKTEA